MAIPILSIIIPTYNRENNLSLLLDTLAVELNGLEDKVQVIIGDNASSDDTPSVIQKFQLRYSSVIAVRHLENVGADENFCHCIDHVQSRYFWIIGDDDLPKSGLLSLILNLLDHESIDLLYLNSEWMPDISRSSEGEKLLTLDCEGVTRSAFARQVNVWVTFISGMVVNLQRLRELDPLVDPRKYAGSSLVQLGWVLPLLMAGGHFKIVNTRCILATSGNSGGYKLFNVFGDLFPKILADACSENSKEYKAIMGYLRWSYIPRLIWMSRFAKNATPESEEVLKSMPFMRSSFAYWLVMVPIFYLNRPFAYPFMQLVGLAEKYLADKNRLISFCEKNRWYI